ncbi:hypothetical protein [Pseudooceanicola sp.]|uniref:hypothetical protein n=1 Tax=Pseudooceanicola sp. TaxID=1914328 RepID=UPI0026291E68|nr:hypothetical protein [Pseudooceanicola sp.]MDF1856312.1 hypothetical protein [Pseudooceanicola sp.]
MTRFATGAGLSLVRTLRLVGLAAVLIQAPVAMAEEVASPYELQPNDFENFSTSNFLPRGTFKLDGGTLQADPSISTPGTGNQLYYARLAYAPIDGLEFGVAYQHFVDPPVKPIAGYTGGSKMTGGGLSAKLRLYQGGRLSVSAQVAAEMMRFQAPFFGSTANKYLMIGSAHLPLTYDITPTLQAHLTPGISIFPNSRGGSRFYGKVASIGAGLSWKPTPRTLVYGTITQPLTGANTIFSDGSYGRRPVVTFGGRYNVAPNSSIEAYATNGIGVTRTTGVLTHFPDGDFLVIGLKFGYTFGRGSSERLPYGRRPETRVTDDQRSFAGDGFTLLGARIRERGTGELTAFGGTHGAYGMRAMLAIDHFTEVGFSYESIANDGSGSIGKLLSGRDRWTGHAKQQFLEQIDGDPVSLALSVSMGRDLNQRGVFFAALPVMRELNSRTAIKLVPKLALYGNNEELGLGFGANFTVSKNITLIGEYTLRNNGAHIWAAGAKARVPNAPIEVSLHATNALGAYGVNSMTSQSDPKIVLSVSLLQKLFR